MEHNFTLTKLEREDIDLVMQSYDLGEYVSHSVSFISWK